MVFVVDQRHVAVVSGRDETTLQGPGLHVKLPTPLQDVTYIDTRVLTVDAPDEDRYTTSDKIELLVNPVIRYRVTDPMKLIVETKGDPQSLPERLALLSRNALADAFAKESLSDALAKQDQIGNDARDGMQKAAASLGVDVLGVQLSRIDFPPAMADTVYKRMIAAREQIAAQERAKGTAEAEQIRAAADRQQQALLADAYDQAQTIKGDGDAKAAAISAESYNRDPQFYQFYQSMQAYRDSFKPGDVIVVDSTSDFFRFMRNPAGETAPATPETTRKH
jgi:modulator of FtsH protease HflC